MHLIFKYLYNIYVFNINPKINIIFFFQNNEYIQSVARCLQMMLRIDEYRLAFVAVDGISK